MKSCRKFLLLFLAVLLMIPAWGFAEGETVTVTFKNGDTVLKETTVEKGQPVEEYTPTEEQLDGKVLTNWYLQTRESKFVNDKFMHRNRWDFSTPVNEDITLECKLVTPGESDVWFSDIEGKNISELERTVNRGEKITDPPEGPKVEGYQFIGWYEKERYHIGQYNEYSTENMLPIDFANYRHEGNLSLYAKYIKEGDPIPEQVRVSFEIDGKPYGVSQILYQGDLAKLPVGENKRQKGKLFQWYKKGTDEVWNFFSPVEEDMVLEGRFIDADEHTPDVWELVKNGEVPEAGLTDTDYIAGFIERNGRDALTYGGEDITLDLPIPSKFPGTDKPLKVFRLDNQQHDSRSKFSGQEYYLVGKYLRIPEDSQLEVLVLPEPHVNFIKGIKPPETKVSPLKIIKNFDKSFSSGAVLDNIADGQTKIIDSKYSIDPIATKDKNVQKRMDWPVTRDRSALRSCYKDELSSFTRFIYSDYESLKADDPLLKNAGKDYLLNPVKIKVNYTLGQGNDKKVIQSEEIVGESNYKLVGEKEPNTKKIDIYYEKNDNPEYIHNYSITMDDPAIEKLFGGWGWPKPSLRDAHMTTKNDPETGLGHENYYQLGQDRKVSIKPAEGITIGHKYDNTERNFVPKNMDPISIDLKDKSLMTLNKESNVWETEVEIPLVEMKVEPWDYYARAYKDWSKDLPAHRVEGFLSVNDAQKYYFNHNGKLILPTRVDIIDKKTGKLFRKDVVKSYRGKHYGYLPFHTYVLNDDSVLDTLDLQVEHWEPFDNGHSIEPRPADMVNFELPKTLKHPLKEIKNFNSSYFKGLILDGRVTPDTVMENMVGYYEYDRDSGIESRTRDIKNQGFARYIYSDVAALKSGDEESQLLAGSGKQYLLNPVRINVKHVDKYGKLLEDSEGNPMEETIVGERSKLYDLKEIGDSTIRGINVAPKIAFGDDELEFMEENGERWVKDFNLWTNFVKDPEKLDMSNSGLNCLNLTLRYDDPWHGDFVGRDMFFMLQQHDDVTIKSKDLEGYQRPKAQTVSFDVNSAEDLKAKGFKLNKEDLVWEKDITFTYLKDGEEPAQEATVTFEADGKTFDTQELMTGQKVSKPAKDPTKEGYKFVEWQKDGAAWNFDDPVESDMTLVAKFEKEEDPGTEKFTVNFEANGEAFSSQTVSKGEKINKPTPDPTKEGYKFVEWQKDGVAWNFDDPVESDMTLVAKFEKEEEEPVVKEYTVNFLKDGKIIKTVTVKEGNKVRKPSNPEPVNKFKGWYYEGIPYDFSKPVTEDINLTAKFEEEETPTVDIRQNLRNAVSMIENLVKDEDAYTPESWANYENAHKAAKDFLEGTGGTEKEANELQKDFTEAFGNLELKKDTPSEDTKAKLKEIGSVNSITVKQGTKKADAIKKLPETVKITDTNNKTYRPVLNWTIYNYDGDKPGSYIAKATFNWPKAFDFKDKGEVTTNVIVEKKVDDIKSVDSLDDITILEGQKPALPKTVKVKYADGSSKNLKVDWDLSKFDPNTPGKYEITGTIKGTDKKAKIVVEVKTKGSIMKTQKPNYLETIRDIRGHWGERAMLWTLENGIFKGTEDQRFEPDRGITRGEFTTVLFRLSGESGKGYTKNVFLDVGNGYYYDVPIEWARQKNLVNGYEDSKFRPERPITREEMASMINRYINYKDYRFNGITQKEFTDVDQISDWARQDVNQLKVYGLVQGREGHKFYPKANVTRAEIAQILFNMDQRMMEGPSPVSVIPTDTETSDSNIVKEETTVADSSKDTSDDEGKPVPAIDSDEEKEEEKKEDKKETVTVSIDLINVLTNMDKLDPGLVQYVPTSGYILTPTEIELDPGDTVWDVTKKAAEKYNIDFDAEFTYKYNSVYVKAINNIGEFDAGENSGWMYTINGAAPNRGASIIKVKNNDNLKWRYTVVKGDVADSLTPM